MQAVLYPCLLYVDMNESATLNASVNSTQVIERINAEKYLVPIAFGLIFLLGVIGNGSLIFIICRYKSMRNLPNMFIFNLALGDLFILLFTVPFTSTIYTFDLWPFGEFICKASEFAKDTSVSVSVFTLTALSFERYNVIVKPVQSYVTGPNSKQCIIISLAIIWLASIALALPAAIFSRLVDVKLVTSSNSSTTIVVVDDIESNEITQNETSVVLYRFCYPFPGKFGMSFHSRSVILGRFLIQYLIPLVTIATFYTITARNLLRSTDNIDGQATAAPTRAIHNSSNNLESRRKVALMVQSFVALFLICFLPMHIFFMWFYFDADSQKNFNHFWNSLRIVGFVFAYANSCVNPVALYFISTNFRKHFHRLLFSRCQGNRSDDDKTVKPRHHRRRDGDNPLNEFQQLGSNPLTSLLERQTPSDKRTTSSQNESDVIPQIDAVISVHDENSQIIQRNPLSVISSAI